MSGIPPASTGPFGQYADFYDAFNQQKDYRGEAAYLLEQARRWRGPVGSWLDVGCGTGGHLSELQRAGVRHVEGVDASSTMISRARAAHPAILFHVDRSADYQLRSGWDVISLLFHVMSYQTSEADVVGTLNNAASHLAAEGVLVFDFWHTGGLLNDPPTVRTREASIEGRRMFRIGRPAEDRAAHTVNIHYEFRWDATDGPLAHQEHHAMRHFTAAELRAYLAQSEMEMLACEAWMQRRPLEPGDWYGLICARKGSRR